MPASVTYPLTKLTGEAIADALPAGAIRGRSVAVPAWDEDALTLACRAARALPGLDDVEHVVLALGQPVDQPRVALWHLGLDDVPITVLAGPSAGHDALALASDHTLVLGGTAPRPSGGGPHDVGAAGAAIVGPAEPAPLPPDVLTTVGRPAGLEPLVGAALASKDVVAEPLPERRIDWAGAVARRHRLDVVPPWQQAAQGAHVSQAEWDADGAARYRLVISRDGGGVAYPPAPGGPGEDVALEGTVAAATTIAPAGVPGEFAEQARSVGGYDVVIVEHDEGFRVIGQVCADTPTPRIGDRVSGELRLLFRQEGSWRYAVKWRRV